ncbi:MAG: acyl-CoA thioesterase domain-containing protein [bacterium]|nr:hypothetical protein [Gammaproteobacteria bacterium]HIL97115.1 hypothetical protein [Pseudomonadales bacterium]
MVPSADPSTPIHYQVERLREGRGSDTRNISAYQSGKRVFQMMANFKLPGAGEEHQKPMPNVIDPDELRPHKPDRAISLNRR